MPVYFPTPYPDELLYSLLARYHRHTASASASSTVKDLYGIGYIHTSIDLPGNIGLLAAHLPEALHLDTTAIINRHTLYPFYAAYANKENAEKAYIAMESERKTNIHACFGITASQVSIPSRLRYCPKCNAEDMECYGELYWHRLYQVPGVLVCTRHNLMLQESTVLYRPPAALDLIAATADNCNLQYPNLEINRFPLLSDIARSCERLLIERYEPKDLNNHVEQWRSQLRDAGLFIGQGRYLDKASIINKFKMFCSSGILKSLHLEFDATNPCNWLIKITYHNSYRKAYHPIQHILMNLFIVHLKNFILPIAKPFGIGPWPCLNPAADHYRNNTIYMVHLTETRKKQLLGIFTCNCGFSYTRLGPESSTEERYVIHTMKSFGHIWENRLKELVEGGQRIKNIMIALKVDRITIKRHAELLGLELTGVKALPQKRQVSPTDTITNLNLDNSVEDKRKKWLDLRARFQDFGKWRLRNLKRT